MSRRNRQYERGDDPIDWSGFDQRDAADEGPVQGSTPLAVLCGAMVVLGIVVLIWGLNALGGQLEQLQDGGGMGDFGPLALTIVGPLTLIPAVFGLQAAGKPLEVGYVAPTVLGIAGIFISIVLLGASLISQGASPAPWAAALVLALAYLFLVVRVHKAANEVRARAYHGAHSRRRPTKDELWDEGNVWK